MCEFRLNEGEAVILQIFATTHLLFLGLEKWHNLVIMFFNILGYGYWWRKPLKKNILIGWKKSSDTENNFEEEKIEVWSWEQDALLG